MIVRNHLEEYIYGRMSPLRGASTLQAHLWVMHMALEWALRGKLLE